MQQKKILLSGINGMQVGKLNKLEYLSIFQTLKKILEDIGCKVDWKPISYGEDLSSYDKVILGMAPIHTFLAGHTIGFYYALSFLPEDKIILTADDWRIKQMLQSFETAKSNTQKYFIEKAKTLGWKESEYAVDLIETVKNFNVNNYQVILPAYEGGDLKMTGIEHAIGYDLSSYSLDYYNYKPVSPGDRLKNWINVTLVNQTTYLKRQKFNWSVISYGCKALDQEQLKEVEVADTYCKNWGVICAPYYLSGSGWWRFRPIMAAQAGAIMYGDEKELDVLYGESTHFTKEEIENASVEMLTSIAKLQKTALYKKIWDKTKIQDFWKKKLELV